MNKPTKEAVREVLLSCGAAVCGIAAIDRFSDAPAGFSPRDIYPACQSVIVFAQNLPQGLTHVDSRLVYGHYNALLADENDRIALKAARELEARFSLTAVPLPSDGPYDYWDADRLTGKGLISMKHAAVLAGLGQLGKNSLLVSPRFGNQLSVGAILTDLPLPSDEGAPSVCLPGCHKCIDACPVHAIENGRVNQTLCRPNAYGKTARGADTVECNRCRVVCPMRFGLPVQKETLSSSPSVAAKG